MKDGCSLLAFHDVIMLLLPLCWHWNNWVCILLSVVDFWLNVANFGKFVGLFFFPLFDNIVFVFHHYYRALICPQWFAERHATFFFFSKQNKRRQKKLFCLQQFMDSITVTNAHSTLKFTFKLFYNWRHWLCWFIFEALFASNMGVFCLRRQMVSCKSIDVLY